MYDSDYTIGRVCSADMLVILPDVFVQASEHVESCIVDKRASGLCFEQRQKSALIPGSLLLLPTPPGMLVYKIYMYALL